MGTTKKKNKTKKRKKRKKQVKENAEEQLTGSYTETPAPAVGGEAEMEVPSIYKKDNKRAEEIRQKFARVRSRVRAFRAITENLEEVAHSLVQRLDSTARAVEESDDTVLHDIED